MENGLFVTLLPQSAAQSSFFLLQAVRQQAAQMHECRLAGMHTRRMNIVNKTGL